MKRPATMKKEAKVRQTKEKESKEKESKEKDVKGFGPIKKDLLKIRETILKDIGDNIKTERSAHDREVGDFYDEVDIEKDRQMIYTLGERERSKLNEINNALEKISDGSYGICEECGGEINKKRLKIIPFAKYCVNCQSEMEKRNQYAIEENLEENLIYKDISITDMEGSDE
jgi:DnaK suppressor protein